MRTLLPLLLLAAACTQGGPDSPIMRQATGTALAVAPPEELNYHPDLQVEIAAMRKLPSGVLLQDLVDGAGDSVAAGTTVLVRYSGWLPDGTLFDSNADATPFQFRVGAGMVIPGWDDGLVGMKTGGRRKLVIPPDLGYGADGMDVIPPNATLVFDVEVLEIRR